MSSEGKAEEEKGSEKRESQAGSPLYEEPALTWGSVRQLKIHDLSANPSRVGHLNE